MAPTDSEPSPGIRRRTTNRDQLLGKAVTDATKGCLSMIKQIFASCFTGIKHYVKPNRAEVIQDEENKSGSCSSPSTHEGAKSAANEAVKRNASAATSSAARGRGSSDRPATTTEANQAQVNSGNEQALLVEQSKGYTSFPAYASPASQELVTKTATDGAAHATPITASTVQDHETLQAKAEEIAHAENEAISKPSELDKNLESDEMAEEATGFIPLAKVKTRRPSRQPVEAGPSGHYAGDSAGSWSSEGSSRWEGGGFSTPGSWPKHR